MADPGNTGDAIEAYRYPLSVGRHRGLYVKYLEEKKNGEIIRAQVTDWEKSYLYKY